MNLTFLAADLDPERMKLLRGEVRWLASRKDFTYRLFAVARQGVWQQLKQEDLAQVSVALIDSAYPGAPELGRQIYEANPFCRLTYYCKQPSDVVRLLHSRPVGCMSISANGTELRRFLDVEYEMLLKQKRYLHYEDRYQQLAVPYSGILYFTSRDRMVYYCTASGECGPLRRSLDQIEEMLDPGCFLRCHKSYLVRRELCIALDKTARELVLADGRRIPVSRACWPQAAALFDTK